MFQNLISKFLFLIAVTGVLSVTACTKSQDTDSSKSSSNSGQPSVALTKEQFVEKGQKVFQMNCLSCHGPDPRKDGPIGPSIAGSSLELITMRVMEVKYPAGYKPKRPTSSMVALPHLKAEIPALYEYLNSTH